MSPYDQFDEEIKHLIRQGCTQNEVLQQLTVYYPQLMNQAMQVLLHIQAVERNLRQSEG